MPFIDSVKRINVEEFKDEDKEVAERIGNVYNYFAEQVTNTINGRLDFENLDRNLVQLNVIVDANGLPVTQTRFSSNIGVTGTNIVRADNLTNSTSYPSSAPFITYTASGDGFYTVNHITGLVPNNRYRLVVELLF